MNPIIWLIMYSRGNIIIRPIKRQRLLSSIIRCPTIEHPIIPPPTRVPHSPLKGGVGRGIVFHHESVPTGCIVRVESRPYAGNVEVLGEGQLAIVEDRLTLLTGAEETPFGYIRCTT